MNEDLFLGWLTGVLMTVFIILLIADKSGNEENDELKKLKIELIKCNKGLSNEELGVDLTKKQ